MKKTLIMMLCSMLAISSVAMGSVAYLTQTAALTNSFTVGDVTLKLDETLVDKYGDPVDENNNPIEQGEDPVRTSLGNKYHLLPGESYVKDPVVTIDKDSESSYVRLLVTITEAAELEKLCKDMHDINPVKYPNGLPQDHVSGFNTEDWIYETKTEDAEANTVTYEFRYKEIVTPDGQNVVLTPLFTDINVPTEITGSQLKTIANFEVKVEANAIQARGFADADAAWSAFAPETAPAAGNGSGAEEGNQQGNAEQGV